MAPRPRCPVCRSKRWHRDALSGSIVCEEGHVLTGYVQETTESQEPSQHVQQTRRQRKNKQRKERVPANDYFHGDRGTFLVWQCMQFILREQLRVLIDEMGWPAELEAVTRDLWAMLVASSRVPPTPMDYERGEENAGSYSGPRPGDRYIRSGRPKWGGRVKKDAKGEADDATDEDGAGSTTEQSGHASGSGSDESSVSSYFSDADADDERPRDGSRSRRGTPTASAAESPAPSAPGTPAPPEPNIYAPPKPRPPAAGPSARNKDDPRAHPRMDYLLLVIYLACITLRLPVFLSDIVHLAETYQILYLDAATHLPLEMQTHLTMSNRKLLSPVTVPHLYSPVQTLASANHAQVWLARLVLMYRDDWNVEFPEANMPLIVGRLCRVLALPPVAYLLIRRILSLLPQPHSFHLPTSLSASDARRKGQPRYSRSRARPAKSASVKEKGLPSGFRWLLYVGGQEWRSLLPELKVACAVVIVAKMLWALEDAQDEAASSLSAKPLLEEYSSDLPSSDRWLATVEAIASLEKPGDLSQLWSTEVVDMGGDDIDAYLDFFEGKILSEKKIPSRMADFSRFFPEPVSKPSSRSTPTASSYISQLDALITSLYTNPSPTSADITPPSSSSPASYPSHPAASSSSDLPAPLSRLLVALCSHLLPVPDSLPNSLSGPVPTHSTAGIAYLLPHLSYVEHLLALRSIPRQKTATKAARADEKGRNAQLRQQRAKAAHERVVEEKKRRRDVEDVVKAERRARKGEERKGRRGEARESRRVTFKGKPSAKSDVWVGETESEDAGDDDDDDDGGSASGENIVAGSKSARGGKSTKGDSEKAPAYKSAEFVESSEDED
ncbi:hypothetical protein JCM5296_006808 [Sporobolomyces johnsonii]